MTNFSYTRILLSVLVLAKVPHTASNSLEHVQGLLWRVQHTAHSPLISCPDAAM